MVKINQGGLNENNHFAPPGSPGWACMGITRAAPRSAPESWPLRPDEQDSVLPAPPLTECTVGGKQVLGPTRGQQRLKIVPSQHKPDVWEALFDLLRTVYAGELD